MTDAERPLTPKALRDQYAEFVHARQALGCEDGLLRQFLSDLAVAERMLTAHDAAVRALEAERDALWAKQLDTEARATANLALAEEWEDAAMRVRDQLAALRQQVEDLIEKWRERRDQHYQLAKDEMDDPEGGSSVLANQDQRVAETWKKAVHELRARLTPAPSPP